MEVPLLLQWHSEELMLTAQVWQQRVFFFFRLHQWIWMASGKKPGFSVFSVIPREQRGHRFDWKELIYLFFFRYLSVLMHNSNLISNTDAKLLHSIIIVVFNKLELLLQ